MATYSLKMAILLLGVSSFMSGISMADTNDSGFYNRKSEGWFWYEVEPEEPELVEPETQIPPPSQPIPQSPAPMTENQSAGPSHFSAAWFRENMQKYKDAWWDNPTVENAQAFAYMQRFAMDRSELAQEAYELAILGDPYLDEVSRRPYATYASQKVDRKAGRERKTLANTVAERAGLFFFFQSNCDMCEVQAPIVKMLQDGYDFTVVAVSADGNPFPGNLFPNYRTDSGHAAKLGVITYPALFLVDPNGKFAPIGQGVMSLPDAINRILVTAKREGWISENEFNKTKALVNTDNNVSEILTPGGSDAGGLNNLDNNQDGNYIPPEQLMELIRNKLQE